MHSHQAPENKTHSPAKAPAQKQGETEPVSHFQDHRTRTLQLQHLQHLAHTNPRIRQTLQLQARIQQHTLNTAQRIETEEEEEQNPAQGKFETIQKQAEPPASNNTGLPDTSASSVQATQRKSANKNNTGLPDTLKSGIENLSGYSLDDVKVHYNSPAPAQLQAHAYAQGTDIHLAPGQEKHLPHEAWHVVQQKQGRVQPTTQLKGKVNINDDSGLEKEADVMGAKALQFTSKTGKAVQRKAGTLLTNPVTQRALAKDKLNVAGEDHDESGARRGAEARFTTEETGGKYWTESDFLVTISIPQEGISGQVEADPLLLQWFNGLQFLSDFIEGFRQNILALFTSSVEWSIEDFKDKVNLVSGTTRNMLDTFEKLRSQDPTQRKLLNQQNNISTIEKILAQAEVIQRIRVAEASFRGKAAQLASLLRQADPSTHRDLVKKNFNVTDELDVLIRGVEILKDAADFKLNRRQVSFVRSLNMADAAQKNHTAIGVWKIGEQHAQDIKQGWQNATFNLLTQAEFNALLIEWASKNST